MVLATASVDTQKLELKSLPGAFVTARVLSYGEKIARRAMVSKMKMMGSGKSKDFEGEFNLVNEEATLFDFKKCVIEHNLEGLRNPAEPAEGDNIYKLDLSNAADIKKLDPKVGEEVSQWLDTLNNFEESDDSEN